MNSTDLGFEFPKFEGVTVCQCLGEGLTSRVYRVKIAAKSREVRTARQTERCRVHVLVFACVLV